MLLNNFYLRLVKALAITLSLSRVLHCSAAVPCNVSQVIEGQEATLFCDFQNHSNKVIKVTFYPINDQLVERTILQCRDNFQNCTAWGDFKYEVVDYRYMQIRFIANKSHEGNYSCTIVPTDQLRECTLYVFAKSPFVDPPLNGTTPAINDTKLGESGTTNGSSMALVIALVLGLTVPIIIFAILCGIVTHDVRRRRKQERDKGYPALFKESIEKRLCCCCTYKRCNRGKFNFPKRGTSEGGEPDSDDETDSAQRKRLISDENTLVLLPKSSEDDGNPNSKLDITDIGTIKEDSPTSDKKSFGLHTQFCENNVNKNSKLDAKEESVKSTKKEEDPPTSNQSSFGLHAKSSKNVGNQNIKVDAKEESPRGTKKDLPTSDQNPFGLLAKSSESDGNPNSKLDADTKKGEDPSTSDENSFELLAKSSDNDGDPKCNLDAMDESRTSAKFIDITISPPTIEEENSSLVADGGEDSRAYLFSVFHEVTSSLQKEGLKRGRLKFLLQMLLTSIDDWETDGDTSAAVLPITLGEKEKDTATKYNCALLTDVPIPPSNWPELENLSKHWYRETLAAYLAKEFFSDETFKLQKYLRDLEFVLHKVQVYLKELQYFSSPLHVKCNPKVLEPKLIAVKEICEIRIDIFKAAIAEATGRIRALKRTNQMLARTISSNPDEEPGQQTSSRDDAKTSIEEEEDIRN